MKTLLIAALLVVLAEMGLGNRSPGYVPGGRPGGRPAGPSSPGSAPKRRNCLDVNDDKRVLGETWIEQAGRYSCKCVPFDHGLFSVPPGMDRSPKKWCTLLGCMRGDTFIAPGDTKNGCHCIPGTDPRIQDASQKYHCDQ